MANKNKIEAFLAQNTVLEDDKVVNLISAFTLRSNFDDK